MMQGGHSDLAGNLDMSSKLGAARVFTSRGLKFWIRTKIFRIHFFELKLVHTKVYIKMYIQSRKNFPNLICENYFEL